MIRRDGYVYFRFEFDEALIEFVRSPPEGWLARFKRGWIDYGRSDLGKEWLSRRRSAVLSVSSSVIPSSAILF